MKCIKRENRSDRKRQINITNRRIPRLACKMEKGQKRENITRPLLSLVETSLTQNSTTDIKMKLRKTLDGREGVRDPLRARGIQRLNDQGLARRHT